MRWGQLGNPSSHWTIGLSRQWFFVGLAALTLFHAILASLLPPLEVELYYWTWSKNLSASYFDHPPMVAYLIRSSTAIFGDTLFAIRLPAVLIGTLVMVILALMTPRQQVAGLFLLTPLFLIGSILMTPDLPLVLFWSLYVAWLVGANRVLNEWHGDPVTRVYRRSPVSFFSWALGGALLGLGTLSSFTMLLAIPCTLAVLLTKYRLKGWIAGFGLLLLIAALVVSPAFAFNFKHGFAPLQFHWANTLAGGEGSGGFLAFLRSQLLLVGALPFFLLPIALLKAPELCGEPRMQVCFYFFFLPACLFLFLATGNRLESHWAVIAYLSFIPLAQWLVDYTSFRGLVRGIVILSFVVPLVASIAFLVHLAFPLKWVHADKDTSSRLKAQFALSETVAREAEKLAPGVPVFTKNLQWTSYLRFGGLKAEQLKGEARESQFTLVAKDPCALEEVLVFHDFRNPPGGLGCFGQAENLGEYPLVVRGAEIDRLSLVRYRR